MISKNFSVTPGSTTEPTSSLDSFTWFNQNGNVIKTQAPGGMVQKYAYDGAGRLVASYLTDGGGDVAPASESDSWTDAGNVTDDIVLEQSESQYDADGNTIFQISRQRFHDATATGALGDPSSTTQPNARVYYSEFFYDPAGRTIAGVNLGTNGGTVLTSRPDHRQRQPRHQRRHAGRQQRRRGS